MSPDLVVVAALAVFLAFVLLEIPIGIALVVAGAVGILLMDGADLAGAVLGAVPFSSTSSYAMFAIPGFVLMGAVIANAGISRHIFYGVSRVLHWLPNSVAVTAVMATTIMSGISGSSAANVATMGRISVKEMRRAGYDTAQAAAIVAAAGAFGALIPPAIGLVVYGIVAGESVGALLLAGIVPACCRPSRWSSTSSCAGVGRTRCPTSTRSSWVRGCAPRRPSTRPWGHAPVARRPAVGPSCPRGCPGPTRATPAQAAPPVWGSPPCSSSSSWAASTAG